MEHSRALDGLRFFAFLAVFMHHLVPKTPIFGISSVFAFGWSGVEVFFAISAFLMMRLLVSEHQREGSIDVPKFLMRRLLRIYPLMAFYATVMVLFFPSAFPDQWARYLGVLSATDNFLSALHQYNMSVSFSSHLWTLSYELQIYLVIPIAVFSFLRLGPLKFGMVLIGVEIVALVARTAFVMMDMHHPIVWVLPFLRPESTLIGLALGAALFRLPPVVAFVILISATWALVTGPNIQSMGPWTMVIYPLCALIAAALLSLSLNSTIVKKFLGAPPIVFLGRISFGLYVYHIWVIYNVGDAGKLVSGYDIPLLTYAFDFGFKLIVTVVIATISFYVVERPFLQLKKRKFSSGHSNDTALRRDTSAEPSR